MCCVENGRKQEEGQKQTRGDQLRGYQCIRSGEEPGGLDCLARIEKLKGHLSYITNK